MRTESAGAASEAGRLELAGHAAGAAGVAAVGAGEGGVVDVGELGDAGGAGVVAGVGGEQAVDVGEQDQEVGVEGDSDAGGEAVVVAELEGACLGFLALVAAVLDQLAHADAVVLVQDRDDAELEQAGQGGAHAEGAVAVAEVLLGEQDLGHLDAELTEVLAVEGHELALADGGAGLAQAE